MKLKTPYILLAEDDEDDFLLFEKAHHCTERIPSLKRVMNGQELISYLENTINENGQLPGLILTDLNMPLKNGFEALRDLKAHSALCHIPVIIFTTSKAKEDILKGYRYGAASFITKPLVFDHLKNLLTIIYIYWFTTVSLPENFNG